MLSIVMPLSFAEWISTLKYYIYKIMIATVKSSLSKMNFSNSWLVASFHTTPTILVDFNLNVQYGGVRHTFSCSAFIKLCYLKK